MRRTPSASRARECGGRAGILRNGVAVTGLISQEHAHGATIERPSEQIALPEVAPQRLQPFSLRLLLATKGLINNVLVAGGFIDTPIDFLGQNVGLYVGLSYAYLLVMIFPLYNAIESLDKNQIEAARDLGAPWWRIHKDVVIPYAKPGIASGCTMVFMFSAGALAAPQFLGGTRTLWFTSVIYNFFFQAFNWPRGAAYAFLLLAACIALVLLMLRAFKVSLGEAIK